MKQTMEPKLETDIAHIKEKVNELYTALMGDRISQDGGMVRRLNIVEERLDKVEKVGAKLGWHFKLLWGAAGGILMAMYSLFIKK
jgi:hypothetical protein